MRGRRTTGMHAAKTSERAGATPEWTAFRRPKFFGVAPARHAESVTVFCPRAYGNEINLHTPMKQFRIQKGENRNASLESTTQTAQNHSRATATRRRGAMHAYKIRCVSRVFAIARRHRSAKLVYRKDKDFQSWLSGQHTKSSAASSKGEC